ncbi:MAG TPA: hypothetical protein VHI93_03675 [Candidatus Thermoplasmatota archaeon]|nr:hypothetical protein [Candidatus Thermoplasmatota archaeon]
MREPCLFLLVALLALAVPAQGHGVFEASELEHHVLNDEGSDTIEAYGGYDINELFVGFAHEPALGPGAAGDGFYFRLEVYGLPANSAPAPGQAWTLQVTADTAAGPLVRSISTTNGKTFTSDFDALQIQVDGPERSTHIQRAFVSYAKAGLAPGQAIGPFRVESRVGGDLRDVAPGGIPVPGTDGAATYADPWAIPGRGSLLDSVALRAPDHYVRLALAVRDDGGYGVTVTSPLEKGGQHAFVKPQASEGWTYTLEGNTSGAIDARGTLAFSVKATAQDASAPLRIDILTDVGGRSALVLGTDLVLRGPEGLSAGPPQATVPSPGAGLPALLTALGLAALRRSAVSAGRGRHHLQLRSMPVPERC